MTYATTFMSVHPKQTILEKNMLGLGFNIINLKKKNASVDLSALKDNMQL